MDANCPSTFDNVSDCLDTCDDYPSEPGDVIGDGPTAVDDNTVECRIYHANNAASGPDGVHCTHASEAGGGVCVDFKGICGDYCGLVVETCANTEGAFETIDDCENACNGLPQGTEGQEGGDTVHCRFTYATRAAEQNDTSLCASAGLESDLCSN